MLRLILVLVGAGLLTTSLAQAHHGPGDHNCSDFATWIEAQTFFLQQGGPAKDPHRLDADGDGIACEGLPNAPQNPATATARALQTVVTSSPTPTAIPTATATPTLAATPSLSPTTVPSASSTVAPTLSPTMTLSASSTATRTPSATRTPTSQPAHTSSPSPTPTLVPVEQLCLAYVYSTDLATAASYRAILELLGIRVDLIPQESVLATDFGRYSATLIGPETGTEGLWGDLALLQANQITATDHPILGLGWGGSSYFEMIDLDLSWSRGVAGAATGVHVTDPAYPLWRIPSAVEIPPNGDVLIYASESPSIAVAGAKPAEHFDHVAGATGSGERYLIMAQYGRYWLWGFNGGPDTMTATGRQLFVNLVRQVPSGLCTAPTLTPTPIRTATGTSTPSVTSTRTTTTAASVTRTATPTTSATTRPSPSPTATGSPAPVIGGRGLALHSHYPLLTWEGGSGQTGYLVVRWSPDTGTTILQPVPLGASAVSYLDELADADGTFCYLVIPIGGSPPDPSQVLALSDLVCLLGGTAFGQPVAPFTLALHQSTVATLQLQVANAVLASHLSVTTFDGTDARLIAIDPLSTATIYETGGVATCFQAQVAAGSEVNGGTNLVCGVPGVGTPGSAFGVGDLHTIFRHR